MYYSAEWIGVYVLVAGFLNNRSRMTMVRRILLGLVITAVTFLTLSMAVVPSFTTSATTSQFVAYNITFGNSSQTFTAVVNETVAPSSTSGLSDITLHLISNMSNFTFSKILNSSQAILTYLPVTGNQSFEYQGSNYSLSVSLTKIGTSSATISGSSYTITNYSFRLSGSKAGGSSLSVSGQVSTLPSGLVYSAVLNTGGYNAQIQLSNTNLTLTASSSGSSTNASVVIAGGFGTLATGIAAFALYKKGGPKDYEDPNQSEQEKKPLYHVD